MWFFKKKKSSETIPTETGININEDDVGMRNLLPLIASDSAFAEMDKAIEASDANRSDSGLGWDKIHVIEQPEQNYEDAGLLLDDCARALEEILPRVTRFEIGFTPNNPFYSKENEAYCYGFGNHLFIKLETKNKYVSNIWYEIQTQDVEELAAIRQAFSAIDALSPSLLSDYWLQSDGYLADSSYLDAYFAEFQKPDEDIAS